MKERSSFLKRHRIVGAERFLRSEAGAVTVDWVILTAGIVGLAVGFYTAFETATFQLRDATAEAIAGEID